MDYAELVKNHACPTDIQQYLMQGEQTAFTVYIPKNLLDAAKEAASMKGIALAHSCE